jgi:hypothetical protein
MPYRAGDRLPAERSGRLGHLEVLKSDLVEKLCRSFENPGPETAVSSIPWQALPAGGEPLALVFGVDGSFQPIESESPPHQALAFVKTALLRLDRAALAEIDKETPHPFALRDLLSDSALYHATVFPLRHVRVPNMTTYDAVRRVIYESIKDPSLGGEPFETLKWIAYEKWDGQTKQLELFECPHCERTVATLPYNAETGRCSGCGGEIYVTDMLGFHQVMSVDAAPDSVATDYMGVHETLLLLTGVRYFWEHNRRVLSDCLFVKDGPLSIRAQYSKLVNPIRRFLAHARDSGHDVHIIGQEKSGAFYDHLQLVGRDAPHESLAVLGDQYIKEQVQHRPNRGAAYGQDTNYGAKVLVKINDYHQMVLNIPTGEHRPNPTLDDLIGLRRVVSTLPSILSNRYEGALLPVELAHGVASLSTYPSARILKVFAEKQGMLF